MSTLRARSGRVPSKGPIRAPAEFDAACENLAQLAVNTTALFAPGLTDEDMLQEARVGVWTAIGDYDPATGVPFAAFALFVARRRLVGAVVAARRVKHRAHNEASRLEAPIARSDGSALYLADVLGDQRQDPVRTVLAREALRDLADRMAGLTAWERECVSRVLLDGEGYAEVGPQKRVDNALQRARRKLATSLPEAA